MLSAYYNTYELCHGKCTLQATVSAASMQKVICCSPPLQLVWTEAWRPAVASRGLLAVELLQHLGTQDSAPESDQ